MTPADEATFITLWQQGASYRELAAALGCPLGTVASRSAALVAQGKITPRPRGEAYASRRAKARDGDPPVRPPAPTRTPGTIKQWTLRLSQPLIDAVKAEAAAEGKEPSHLVEECLWRALSCRAEGPDHA